MSLKITKTRTSTFEFEFPKVGPFTTFDVMCSGRGGIEQLNKRGMGKCFACEQRFEGKQDVYLGFGKGIKNQLFCKSCYEKGRQEES